MQLSPYTMLGLTRTKVQILRKQKTVGNFLNTMNLPLYSDIFSRVLISAISANESKIAKISTRR